MLEANIECSFIIEESLLEDISSPEATLVDEGAFLGQTVSVPSLSPGTKLDDGKKQMTDRLDNLPLEEQERVRNCQLTIQRRWRMSCSRENAKNKEHKPKFPNCDTITIINYKRAFSVLGWNEEETLNGPQVALTSTIEKWEIVDDQAHVICVEVTNKARKSLGVVKVVDLEITSDAKDGSSS